MLSVLNEFSKLTDVCVCRGTAVPPCEGFEPEHPEFARFQMLPWDQTKLLEQQDRFHELLERYGVRLHLLRHSDDHPWQMYTRDIGFVIGSKLYFSALRELPDRVGEIDAVRECLADLDDQDVIEIKSGRIEGGDVLVDEDVVYVGLGTRTAPEAAAELAQYAEVRTLYLGPNVMHLDTRMTILPERNLLICPSAFQPEDLDMLRRRFSVIEVTDAEALAMGTNVFVIDPETVVVHAEFGRISRAIEDRGLKVEPLNFSEPNALLGSFRCATMPLARA